MLARRDQFFCEVCAAPASDQHHVIHRSQGGTDHDHNLSWMCRGCHQALHTGGWNIVERSATRLLVVRDEEVIVDRRYHPGFDQGEYIAHLDLLAGYLETAIAQVQYLDDDGLVAAAEATRDMGKGIWIYQAELLHTAMLHIPRGARVAKLEAIAKSMGMGVSYAYDLLKIRDTWPLLSEVYDGRKLAPGFYRVASETDNPESALEMAEERTAENPRYTVNQFRRDLRQEVSCQWRNGEMCRLAQFVRCADCPDERSA